MLVVVFLFVLTNLLVDLSYSWLDPRIARRGGGGQRGAADDRDPPPHRCASPTGRIGFAAGRR